MKGVKIMGFSAAAGFLLSFIFGLFSRTSFFSVLLKAAIFAVVFGGLGFLINFLYEKFLSDDSDSDGEIDDENKLGSGESSKTGQIVDITIQDEELDKGESENHFVVNNAYKMLNDSDLEKKSVSSQNLNESENKTSETKTQTEDKGFVPLANHETVEKVSEKETISPVAVNSSDSAPSDGGKNDFASEGVDTLPDIGDLAFETEENTESEDDEVDTEPEFVSSINKKSANAPEIKDAELIAKAISSVLSDADSV